MIEVRKKVHSLSAPCSSGFERHSENRKLVRVHTSRNLKMVEITFKFQNGKEWINRMQKFRR